MWPVAARLGAAAATASVLSLDVAARGLVNAYLSLKRELYCNPL
ncbi:MAG: hypothetical protein ACREU9_06820 [Gammaproteobacteria bacterium]